MHDEFRRNETPVVYVRRSYYKSDASHGKKNIASARHKRASKRRVSTRSWETASGTGSHSSPVQQQNPRTDVADTESSSSIPKNLGHNMNEVSPGNTGAVTEEAYIAVMRNDGKFDMLNDTSNNEEASSLHDNQFLALWSADIESLDIIEGESGDEESEIGTQAGSNREGEIEGEGESNAGGDGEAQFSLGPFSRVPCFNCHKDALRPQLDEIRHWAFLVFENQSFGYSCDTCKEKTWVSTARFGLTGFGGSWGWRRA